MTSLLFTILAATLAMPSDTTLSENLQTLVFTEKVSRTLFSPLRTTEFKKEDFLLGQTGKTYPEIANSSPGIYASAENGGFGEAKINIRGFKQENISVLLNGIPISGLTS